MKPSYTSNEMIQLVEHFDVSKVYEIKKTKKHSKFQLCLAPLETPHRGTSL